MKGGWHSLCKAFFMRRPCLIAILAFAGLGAHAAGTVLTEIPFESREGLLWLKAKAFPSGESLNLLLDTGAGISVLNTAAAERLGLNRGRAITVRGVESTLAGHSLKPVSLTAEGIPLPAIRFAVDLHPFSDSCALPVDGLLGADFFRGRIVQIDFEAKKLRILATSPARQNADSIPLQLRPCGMRVPIQVNGGHSQWVRLDTGCLSALQWVTSSVRSEDCSQKAAIGLTQISIPQIDTTVEIGSQKFGQVPTGIHEKPIFMGEAGLLGNGLLSRFSRLTIDAKSGRLILESR